MNANGMILFNPAGHLAISILFGGEFLAIQTFSLPWGMPGLHRGVLVRAMDRNAFVLDAPLMALSIKRLRNQRGPVVRAYVSRGVRPIRLAEWLGCEPHPRLYR